MTNKELKELKKRLDALKRIHLKTANIDYLINEYRHILHLFRLPVAYSKKGEFVYRAVKWAVQPLYRHQLSCAPLERLTKYQRLNPPGQQIFYASSSPSGALLELGDKESFNVAIGCWEILEDCLLPSLGYSKSIFESAGSGRWGDVTWAHLPKDYLSPSQKLVSNYLNEEFTKRVPYSDDWLYKTTVALSSHVLRPRSYNESMGDQRIDGIIYPSVAMSCQTDNVGFIPEIVDKKLKLVSVEYLQVKKNIEMDAPQSCIGLDFSAEITSEGNIKWIGQYPNGKIPMVTKKQEEEVIKKFLQHLGI